MTFLQILHTTESHPSGVYLSSGWRVKILIFEKSTYRLFQKVAIGKLVLMKEVRWKILAVEINIIMTLAAYLFYEEWNVLGFLKVISQEVVKHSHCSMSCSLWFYILYKGFGAEIGKT